jgi:hypothetical protein
MPTTGAIATLRDLLEAMGKTWDHRVVRYDLQQQMVLFGGMRARFRTIKASFSSTTARLSAVQGSVPIGLALVGVTGAALIAIVIWRRRRRENQSGSAPNQSVPTQAMREATAIYELLQSAMASAGVPRSPGTPPLLHARKLVLMGHPAAADVERVTTRYLRARFGEEPITHEERADLEQCIRRVRHTPPSLPKSTARPAR